MSLSMPLAAKPPAPGTATAYLLGKSPRFKIHALDAVGSFCGGGTPAAWQDRTGEQA
ncbi:hypothetical protein GCM10017643_17030 [Ancylobacter dichloromethanicus]|uniref:Uncharacterized protein n=1 Tax=Ancylobacter dichloromethanicus TaxID=518825 RepID=A0A9W6J9L7_9HYPH|nr:hypothetical protein GCM10017643_17030 [Ancylobacter dichloromethanicus]